MVLHNPDVQKKVLKEEALAIMEEAINDEVEGLRICVEVHNVNLKSASVEEMLSWARSVRIFKNRACKSEHQYMRNMLNTRVN